MLSQEDAFYFKGDLFKNRYRIEGELIARTPTHIGTGETRKETSRNTKSGSENQDDSPEISEIARDFSGRPYVPGSALRGVVRNYLLQIFRSFEGNIAANPDFEKCKEKYDTQKKQVEYMSTDASLLEQLFGTPFSESKIEFWDAPAINKINGSEFVRRGWDDDRQCYVIQSVAIDPITGTAETHKLYSFEVAPKGLRYEVNIVGQNLTDIELGFVIFGLYGFNSPVYPLTIGAMSGRGFGQMSFDLKKIYEIRDGDLENWAKDALLKDHAGYSALPLSKNKDELIKSFKDAFYEKIKRPL